MKASLSNYPGGQLIKTLNEGDFKYKRVFVRVDFNVPIKDGVISDDTRIRAALPTLKFLKEKGAKLIIASHLGRPKGKPDPKYSMEPVASVLGELLGSDVIFAHDAVGLPVQRQTKEIKDNHVLLLENLRYYPGEEANEGDFAVKLASLCDVYVNDAFGTCHRAHASVSALPKLMTEKYAGFLLEKEIAELARVIHNPERPFIAILGGSKVSDKVGVIEALVVKSSKIIIGGAMAYTFLRALNVEVGDSRVELDKVALAGKILERAKAAKCKILLPVDHMMADAFDSPHKTKVSENAHIPAGWMGLDIGPKTLELYSRELEGARCVFWNGPMGVFERSPFEKGTLGLALAIGELPNCIKVCGGGDSVSALHMSGAAEKFTHISTGGGASLEMIEGHPMPGIESLKRMPK
ncbi:MAG: phosphoglycerate kinase [Bdellovibrionota bacterium]